MVFRRHHVSFIMKRCPKCKETKAVELFEVDRRERDGRHCWCRECRKDIIKRAKARFDQRNPHILKAWRMLNNAVDAGKIKRGPCEVCGTTVGVHGHHDDYSKPLEVRWLCKDCHREYHRVMKEDFPW